MGLDPCSRPTEQIVELKIERCDWPPQSIRATVLSTRPLQSTGRQAGQTFQFRGGTAHRYDNTVGSAVRLDPTVYRQSKRFNSELRLAGTVHRQSHAVGLEVGLDPCSAPAEQYSQFSGATRAYGPPADRTVDLPHFNRWDLALRMDRQHS